MGEFPLTASDLDALIFPSANADERDAVLKGLTFFSTPHTAAEGAGPDGNQPFCQGCHRNSEEVPRKTGLITTSSPISRAGRSTPTDFEFTAFDPMTMAGHAPEQDETIDRRTGAISGTGRTAAFTQFADFNSTDPDPAKARVDPLDGSGPHFAQPHFPRLGTPGPNFGGIVQHVRPSLAACLPDPIQPIEMDPNLAGVSVDPATGLLDPPSGVSPVTGFRRTVGERAAPPYVGRGLMEAIPDEAIKALEDPGDTHGHSSSLNDPAAFPECQPLQRRDCIIGRHNENGSCPCDGGVIGGDLPPIAECGSTGKDCGMPTRVGRFGLRAAGPTLVQFVIGGMQGELGITSPLRDTEPNQAPVNIARRDMGCKDTVPDPEFGKDTVSNVRTMLRLTPPPEFGRTLLELLESGDPEEQRPGESPAARVQRGAMLFGVDLVAFANRTIQRRMPSAGDDRDEHAINQTDRLLNCVGCHTPIQATGESPAKTAGDLGGDHLSFVWAPIFSDLLLHEMTIIDAERHAPTPRDPLLIRRLRRVGGGPRGEAEDREHGPSDSPGGDGHGRGGVGHGPGGVGHGPGGVGHGPVRPPSLLVDTFDIPRNLADDALLAQGIAEGYMWRTPPLMGLGRVGPPFLHDVRVYLSLRTVERTPAGTVMTSSRFTNAPLVVRTVDDALRAAIELHDLPPPDDAKTPNVPGAGCPVPPNGRLGGVDYGSDPESVICPPYDSDTSKTNRSEAREVIRRYRALSPEDQQALIEFLKEL
ncbi:MAG: hypothetical protein E6J50_05430 [Chloroflexi bacterium]|nr:MAG: hypothetical protein E6J50_05430 [Chloroflexota bacterium]